MSVLSLRFTLRAVFALCAAAATLAACSGGGVDVGVGGGAGGGGAKGGSRGTPPPPNPALSGADLTWGAYQLKVPTTMTASTSSGGVVLQKADAASSYGFGCRVFIGQPLARAGTLDDQAAATLSALAQKGQAVIGVEQLSPLDESTHITGVTGEGRNYVQLDGHLVMASNHNRIYGTVRVLAVDLGSQVGWLTGFQPWDASAKCFQEIYEVRDWELLAYSLTFPSVPANPGAFRSALVGAWFYLSSGSIVSYAVSNTFAANGQYSDSFTAETYHQVSPTDILETDSTWMGDGAWAVSGSLLTIWYDNPSRHTMTQYARIAHQNNPVAFLYLLSRAEDGTLFESWTHN